jgi:ADP-heptose:LPS heptosyltransferase
MVEVVKALRKNTCVAQVGGASDPALPGAEDLRGCRDLRHVAAVVANSALFVGMEGFHTHLARAVNCRSVVVYGGYTHPEETGYPCNENLYTELPCSPCWEPSGCNFRRKCLDDISPTDVINAVEKGLARKGQPLEVERAQLPGD